MKKLKQLLAFTLALAMLAIPAMAAGTHSTLGVYDLEVVSGYTLTPLKSDGTAADRYSGQFDGSVSTVYEGVEKFSLSFTGSADQYVVFLLGNGDTVPTEDNIAYIDQNSGGSISFVVYPYELTTGDYNVYVSSNGDNGSYTWVASFSVTDNWEEAPYTLGDVNQDGNINVFDAVLTLNYIVQLEELTEQQIMAADLSQTANEQSRINVFDAVALLNLIVSQA